MSYDLLVEIPDAVVKVFYLGSSAANLGLRSPTVFALEGAIALVNGETGTLYRKYTLPSSKAKIEDCVYVSGCRRFVLALSDKTLVSVPEHSKSPGECDVQKWAVQPKKLICPRDDELYVHCEGGFLCHLSLSEGKARAPSQSPVACTGDALVAGTDFCVGNAHFVVVAYSSKASAKTPSESFAVLFPYSAPATGSSQWLSQSAGAVVPISSSAGHTVVTAVVDEQCDSFFVVLSHAQQSQHLLVKLDAAGCELFRREISSRPTFACAQGGVVWLFDGSRSLSPWNARFGNKLEAIDLPAASAAHAQEGMPCVASAGADSQSAVLLMACVLGKNGPTNVLRKELGSLARVSKVSVFDVIGSAMQSAQTNAQSRGMSEGVDKETRKELDIVREKLHKRTVEEHDHPLQNIKKQRRLLLNTPSHISAQFIERFEACDEESVQDEDWEVCKAFIRSGAVSLHGMPSLLKKVAVQSRLDVLIEIVRFVADLTEVQLVQLMRVVLHMSTETLSEYDVYGCAIVKKSTGLKERTVTEAHKKKGKKTQAHSEEESTKGNDLTTLAALRVLINSVLLRSTAFSATLLSEAFQLFDLNSTCVLLRLLTHSIYEVVSGSAQETFASVNVFAVQSDEQFVRAIALLEALLDAHFLELSLQAPQNEEVRKALFKVIKCLQEAEQVSESVEYTLGLWTQIERITSKQGVHVKPAVGVYQIEKLVL